MKSYLSTINRTFSYLQYLSTKWLEHPVVDGLKPAQVGLECARGHQFGHQHDILLRLACLSLSSHFPVIVKSTKIYYILPRIETNNFSEICGSHVSNILFIECLLKRISEKKKFFLHQLFKEGRGLYRFDSKNDTLHFCTYYKFRLCENSGIILPLARWVLESLQFEIGMSFIFKSRRPLP